MWKLAAHLAIVGIFAFSQAVSAEDQATEKPAEDPRGIELQGPIAGGQRGRSGPVPGQGRAGRERGQQVRADAAVQGAGSALPEVQRPRAGDSRFPLQPVPRAGAGHGRGNPQVLHVEVQRDLPADGQGRGQRRGHLRPLQVLEGVGRQTQGAGRNYLEFREVRDRPQWRGRRPLPTPHHSRCRRGHCRDREASWRRSNYSKPSRKLPNSGSISSP